MNKKLNHLVFYLAIILLGSCRSMDKMVVGKLSDMLSSDSGAGAFTQDNDPQLVADALPITMKMYEMLMDLNPEDSRLKLAAGKVFIMYANAFIQTPASMLSDEEYISQNEMNQRAKKMYIRGRDYILEGMALNHKDFESLMDYNLDELLQDCDKNDVPYLYWSAAGWLGAFSCDPFDMKFGSDISKSIGFLFRALMLDETYDNGAIHSLLLTVWASVPRAIIDKAILDYPQSVGSPMENYYKRFNIDSSSEARARFHFSRAVDLSGGINPGVYIALATSYPVKNQNYAEFETLLDQALSINAEEYPQQELTILIYQKKAQWLLDHREDFFLIDFDSP